MTTDPGAAGDRTMLDVLQGFVHELRSAGLPVSMTENLDAMRGVEHIDIGEREVLRAVLGATLVKHQRHRAAFDTVFDVYFSLFSPGLDVPTELDLPDELFGGVDRRHAGRRRGRRSQP